MLTLGTLNGALVSELKDWLGLMPELTTVWADAGDTTANVSAKINRREPAGFKVRFDIGMYFRRADRAAAVNARLPFRDRPFHARFAPCFARMPIDR